MTLNDGQINLIIVALIAAGGGAFATAVKGRTDGQANFWKRIGDVEAGRTAAEKTAHEREIEWEVRMEAKRKRIEELENLLDESRQKNRDLRSDNDILETELGRYQSVSEKPLLTLPPAPPEDCEPTTKE